MLANAIDGQTADGNEGNFWGEGCKQASAYMFDVMRFEDGLFNFSQLQFALQSQLSFTYPPWFSFHHRHTDGWERRLLVDATFPKQTSRP